MKTKIEVGSYVIINEIDAPCAKLVAQVYKIRGDLIKARYLSKNTSVKKCWNNTNQTTCISDFGMKIEFESHQYTCVQIGVSEATYLNGRHRLWQENGSRTQPLRKWKKKGRKVSAIVMRELITCVFKNIKV